MSLGFFFFKSFLNSPAGGRELPKLLSLPLLEAGQQGSICRLVSALSPVALATVNTFGGREQRSGGEGMVRSPSKQVDVRFKQIFLKKTKTKKPNLFHSTEDKINGHILPFTIQVSLSFLKKLLP